MDRIDNVDKRRDIMLSANLLRSQLSAIGYMSRYAKSRKKEAQQTIDEILQMSNISPHKKGAIINEG